MRSKLVIALCIAAAIVACNKDKSVVVPKKSQDPTSSRSAGRYYDYADTIGSRFIPVSVANTMINSYLYSINYQQNDSDVRSYIINADSLRAYLNNPDIKNVKVMFAHTLDYINAGQGGLPAGYQSGALTIVIAGYDATGDYIYYGGSYVLDHAVPCPYTCAPGDAANALLQ